jgi:uncharacterized protein YkwD
MDVRTPFITVVVVFQLATGPPAAGSELGEPPFRLLPEDRETPDAKVEATATVDNWSRSAVGSHFDSTYVPALTVSMQWSGSTATCTPGTTSQDYIDATFDMINYYRGMVGLPDATNAAAYNPGAQAAALIMSANGALSHNPPTSWTCWSSSGASAAGSSNLALGSAGPNAIVAYILDGGSSNYFVGHRRWILCPQLNGFGTGSVGETTTSANALYVFTGFDPRPASPDKVAWPPEGYVPYQTVYPRWSLSFNTGSSVSFASATVTMTENGAPVGLSVVSRVNNGYCDNTIVWEPSGLSFSAGMEDRRFTVTVSGISVAGSPHSEVYDVVVMDPAVAVDLIFESGFESGTTGAWSSSSP